MKNPVTLLLLLFSFSVCSAQPDSVAQTQTVQPLTVAAFTAKPLDKNIQVTWAVTGNEDAKSFVVERSDASTGWAKVGGKLASGKVGNAGYEFIDAMPKVNTAYSYRLVAIGKDGSVLQSVSQSASVNTGFVCALKQNPVQSTLELETLMPAVTAVRITVLTAYGQKVSGETVKAAAGSNTISLNAANLAPGLYRLVVEAGKQSQVISFVKE